MAAKTPPSKRQKVALAKALGKTDVEVANSLELSRSTVGKLSRAADVRQMMADFLGRHLADLDAGFAEQIREIRKDQASDDRVLSAAARRELREIISFGEAQTTTTLGMSITGVDLQRAAQVVIQTKAERNGS